MESNMGADYPSISEVADLVSAHVRTTSLDPETDLIDQGVLNSIKLMALLELLEDTYDFAISTDDLEFEHFSTITQMQRFIVDKLTDSSR